MVVLAILLGARDDVARAGLGIEEFGAAGIGEGLLDRVDDLHEVGAGAGAQDRVERLLDFLHRVEEIAEQDDVGEAPERAGVGLRRLSRRARE